jgi:hypothetical protein
MICNVCKRDMLEARLGGVCDFCKQAERDADRKRTAVMAAIVVMIVIVCILISLLWAALKVAAVVKWLLM